jgi:hypothetical protein
VSAGVRHQSAPEKMKTNEKEKPGPVSIGRVVRFVLGVVVFGVLMGMRPEFAPQWKRDLIAGIAAAFLALCVLPMRRRRQ